MGVILAAVPAGEGQLPAGAHGVDDGVPGVVGRVFDVEGVSECGLLVADGYKDAAAVIAGSTLEEHLRKLAAKHNVDMTETKRDGAVVPKKAARLNDDLKKACAYNQLESSQVGTWLVLRNNAAHGHFGEYMQAQVEQMIEGIRGFFLRNPA